MAILYLICGMAGSGKTTLAKQLETSQGAIRLCPDDWIKAIIKDETDKTELDRLREPVEKLQLSLCKNLLRSHVDVILENGFWSQEERLDYCKMGKEWGAQVQLHYLDVSKQELWRRVKKRNADTTDGSFHVTEKELDLWLSWFIPPNEQEGKNYDKYVVHQSKR